MAINTFKFFQIKFHNPNTNSSPLKRVRLHDTARKAGMAHFITERQVARSAAWPETLVSHWVLLDVNSVPESKVQFEMFARYT